MSYDWDKFYTTERKLRMNKRAVLNQREQIQRGQLAEDQQNQRPQFNVVSDIYSVLRPIPNAWIDDWGTTATAKAESTLDEDINVVKDA
jgi:hypothetical protein